MSSKRILILLISLLFALCSWANDVKFYNINQQFNISMRQASSVCKDQNGFIWASTITGILRIANNNYRVYQLPLETANVLWVNLACNQSNLIAYTNNGQIFNYDPVNDCFVFSLDLRTGIGFNFLNVTNILLSDDNSCYIASTFGLYQLQNNKLHLISNNTNVPQIAWHSPSMLFVSLNKGTYLMDLKRTNVQLLCADPEYFTEGAKSFYYDEKLQRLWIGTAAHGLYYYDLKQANGVIQPVPGFPRQPVQVIKSIDNNKLLVGVDGQGIWEIDAINLDILHVYKEDADNQHSLNGNGVYDIFFDRDENRVWVCTYTGGVSYFDMASSQVEQFVHQINRSNSLINNDVNSFIEDRYGNYWVATNNGISFYHVKNRQWKHLYENNENQAQVFLTLCEDDHGNIWAGTYASGVYKIDQKTGKQIAHYSPSQANAPFVNSYVFDIYKDSHGDIWIAGINSEVVRYDQETETFRKYQPLPASVMAEFSSEKMLLGCSYGLVELNKKTGEIQTIVSDYLVRELLVFEGIIWIGTSGDGLIAYDPENGNVTNFDIQAGLPSNFVNSIAAAHGYLWLGTENGLCRFDPKTKQVLRFPSVPPLSNYSFNTNSHFKLNNGRLAWGTNNGVVIFDPKQIHHENVKGKIFLQDISISGRSIRNNPHYKLKKPIDELQTIRLKYHQNTISVELVPIIAGGGSKFSWKMDGIDQDWSAPGTLNIIRYSNIPSRNNRLSIRLYDNSNSQILAERSLLIYVTPPFWGTWWFLILSFVLVTACFWFIIWYYISFIKQKLAEEKVRFFTNTAHDMRTALTLIKAPIDELTHELNISDGGRNFLKMAQEQTDRLSAVVTQLMDFRKTDTGRAQLSLAMSDIVALVRNRIEAFKPLASSKQIELLFSSNEENYTTAIDENQMEKVIDNLFSNAIKYSNENSKVEVALFCTETHWKLTISDQGIGIVKRDQKRLFKEFYRGESAINAKIVGSGVGLLLAKNIVALHGGNINFTSEESVGSEFVVSVPFRKVPKIGLFSTSKDTTTFAEKRLPSDALINSYADDEDDKSMTVLLVEDNEDLLHFLKLSFDQNYQVQVALNGAAAWELIQKQVPDLVISDVMMPIMDGYELCAKIKTTYETSHIPVILLTALSSKQEQLVGFGYGADDYISKPFDNDLLKQKIRNILQNRSIVRQKVLGNQPAKFAEPLLGNKLNDQFLKKMIEVVNENMGNTDFGKSEFATAMCVSPSLLYKKTKAITDLSPIDFIKSVRLDHALELLQSQQHSIAEVGELCGFSTPAYFSTVFKKHFGKTPSEYIER